MERSKHLYFYSNLSNIHFITCFLCAIRDKDFQPSSRQDLNKVNKNALRTRARCTTSGSSATPRNSSSCRCSTCVPTGTRTRKRTSRLQQHISHQDILQGNTPLEHKFDGKPSNLHISMKSIANQAKSFGYVKILNINDSHGNTRSFLNDNGQLTTEEVKLLA